MVLVNRGRLRPWLGALLVFGGLTCTDSTGLRSGRAVVTLAPVFSDAAAAIYSNAVAAGLAINNVRLKLTRADGSTAKDTTIAIAAGQDSVVIELEVEVNGNSETLRARIDLRDGTIVLFSGSQNVVAIAGAIPQGPPPPITVEYEGPGATVTSIAMARDDTLVTGDTSCSARRRRTGTGLPSRTSRSCGR